MKGMTLKKGFLLGGIFLLSALVFVQLSLACDGKDKWDCDHHHKWDCDHHHGEQCYPPKIQRVFLAYQDDSIVFEIYGKNFDRGAPPVVTLGGIFDLTIDETLTDDNVITATLSSLKDNEFGFGDYRLVVSTCHDSACENKYCKAHGPKCGCKYCKEHCSKCNDKHCKDNECKCRCKDRYSLTIAGPPGSPAEKGIIKSEIVEVTKSVTVEADTPVYDPNFKIEDTASCNTLGTGFTVTGGGFSSSKNVTIRASIPVKDENGWHVVGTVAGEIYVGAILEVTIYAVCAIVQ
jgi:hypothetical protein